MTVTTHLTSEVSPDQARALFRAGTVTPTAGWASPPGSCRCSGPAG